MNIEAMRRRLEDERSELLRQQAELASLPEDQANDYGVSQHSADDATDLFLRSRNFALQRNAEDLIAQFDAALERIAEGTYGTCRRCNQPINEERLETLPYVAYCIDCQAILEEENA